MAEDREQLLQHYRQMQEGMRTALDGLSDEAMADPSIDGWSVKDHLFHLAVWDDVRADEVIRISAGQETTYHMSTEQDAAFSLMAYELRRDLPVPQAKWEWEHSRQRLLDAITAAPARALDASLYGEAGLVSTHETLHASWIRRWRGERGI